MIIIPYYLYSVDVSLYYRCVIMSVFVHVLSKFYAIYEYAFEHMWCRIYYNLQSWRRIAICSSIHALYALLDIWPTFRLKSPSWRQFQSVCTVMFNSLAISVYFFGSMASINAALRLLGVHLKPVISIISEYQINSRASAYRFSFKKCLIFMKF